MRHSFSVELKSKKHLYQMMLSKEPHGGVFFEGELGEINELEYIEGRVLVVTGSNGTLRIDICESKLIGVFTKSEA
ncbi:hypothetical protein E2P65_01055 [Candidatus Bathyarchaeota archaeon]|nr:hypothetical protein E2P65_01055 [Candidatus Bathyarchaeota archaeon]